MNLQGARAIRLGAAMCDAGGVNAREMVRAPRVFERKPGRVVKRELIRF